MDWQLFASYFTVKSTDFNSSSRQYFSLYRAVSLREGEIRVMIGERKHIQTTPAAPTASTEGPCPTVIQISRTPPAL